MKYFSISEMLKSDTAIKQRLWNGAPKEAEENLRALATQAHCRKAYHLGFGRAATKSNLSKANNSRDYRIFEEFAYRVVAKARECRATEIFKLGGKVYAFDSTTIDLCLSVFEWAPYPMRRTLSTSSTGATTTSNVFTT